MRAIIHNGRTYLDADDVTERVRAHVTALQARDILTLPDGVAVVNLDAPAETCSTVADVVAEPEPAPLPVAEPSAPKPPKAKPSRR